MATDSVTAELLAMGPFAREDAPFALIGVRGPDAADFLQRLCSQDVLGLGAGRAAPAAFLDAKGRLLVTCLVCRQDEGFLLEVAAEQQQALQALLERYHFSERLSIEPRPRAGCRELVDAAADGEEGWLAVAAADAVDLSCHRHGVRFRRLHGAPPSEAGAQPLSAELAECLRMAAGFVRVGVETEASTLVLEADLDDHCSPSKGCYTGQEIVARIHTYGHTNRKLCFLQLGDGPMITSPAPLHEPEDEIAVGRVMHAVPVPGQAVRFGLGYLPPDFQQPGTELTLADGSRAAVVW